MKNSRNVRSYALFSALFALFFIVAISALAQAPTDFSKVEIKTTKVTNNFYVLQGQGGAIGVLAGPDGVLVVDTEYAPLTEKIVAAIKNISTSPIRFVINTHVHGDHTGGNENFGKLGATIFARPELRDRLMHPAPGANGAAIPPAPDAALPVVTYTGPLTFHLDGEEVDAIPVPRAHTDGDTMLHFHVADVIMTGDFYRSAGYPNIDRVNGGSLNGMIEGLGAVVALAGPNTKIVPGHGATVDKAAVAAHRDIILGVRDRVAKMIKDGKTSEEIVAAHVTADYDAKVVPAAPNADKMADRFVGQVYAELKAGK
jgi:cyclase